MKILLLFGLGLTLVTASFASDPVSGEKAAQNQPGKATNTICPVSGDKIGSIGKPVIVEYQGKKIALCCRDCAKDFPKNPAKYSALAAKNSFDDSSSSMSH